MLRRKLTSSKCLFLGKSRIKSVNKSSEVCRHSGSNCTCNVTEMQSCEENISDEVETAAPTERQRHSKSPEAHRSDQNQLIQKLNALKQVFSTSVNCFTSLKPGEGGSHDGGEYHAVTIVNRHTRDSVDLNTAGGISATEMHQFNNAEHALYVKERDTIKSKTFKLLNQLVALKLQTKAKSSNSLRLKAFWRQKPKKASPFFQERIGETEEYMAEEIIVLANEHADESMTPETEVKRHCPERLTVSVDVTAMTLEIRGNNGDSEASKTPSHVRNDMKEVAGNLGLSMINRREIQMIPQSLADCCVTQNSTVNEDHDHSQNVDNLPHSTPDVISKGTASEHPAARDKIRLYAIFNSDSFSIHHDAAAENGPVGSKITTATASPVTDDAAVVAHLDVSGGSRYVMMVHTEPNAEQQCEKAELFLLETACSVVEVAIKTALKQFTDELLGSSALLDPYDWH